MFIAVDIGASSTRFTDNAGKIYVMPNNMVMTPPERTFKVKPYSDKIEDSLEVVINKEGESPYFPIRALIGNLAERASSNNERPTSLLPKAEQRINYVSIITAIAVDKLTSGVEDDVNLYLALPPIEVENQAEIINKNLVGSYTVDFEKFMGGKTVKFNIKSVSCYGESFLAMLSWFFTMDGKQREENKNYARGNILSLDIGASTTDLSIVKDMILQDKSGQTYKVGGNIALEFLSDSIRDKYSCEMPISEVEVAMSEGRMQYGDSYIDISEMVDKAKHDFAERIVNSIKTYFGKVNIPIQNIRAIVVSGGGSRRSSYFNENNEEVVTSKPISTYITSMLQDVCKGVVVKEHSDTPRLANVKGLYIRAMVNESRAVVDSQK